MPFYAVAKGRSVGIYQSWAECEAQVKGFSGARYKKFDTASSAQDFISAGGGTSSAAEPKPKPNHSFANNAATSTNYIQQRSFSTTSSSRQTNGNSSGTNSQKRSQAWQEAVESDDESDDDLNEVLNKQLDDIEKRLKTFERGVDKIVKKGSTKSTDRRAIMIEPPQPKRARKSNNEFEEDSEGYVQVYTDGACSANGKSGARAGIGVYWGDEHSLNISEPVSGRATNNCGEIQAATRAMKQAIDNGVQKLTINTDSQFVINSVTKWMPGDKFIKFILQSLKKIIMIFPLKSSYFF
ncbi:Ribonuclease H1 [Operophtera brumata]|uniref:Ribonuclease H1 n=1 Tax=Operophtera brumata TaxID=104452 RepID=A0A0L7L945_OPEBR|nr:Ribonuclease H1 [Operophtera brumata]